jgi:hypothetical protein
VGAQPSRTAPRYAEGVAGGELGVQPHEYHASKWAEIRNDPERYRAYLERRRTSGHKKAWREANKEQAAEYQRHHQQENPEQWAAYAAKRRALKAGNGGDFTGDEWIAMKQAYDYTCLRCGRRSQRLS